MTNRLSLRDFTAFKQRGEKIVSLSLAHAAFAALADEHADMILVGDSLGMTLYGMDNTVSVTMPMMHAHTQAVARTTKRAFLIADMPFGSYADNTSALKHATQLLRAGAQAVKLEVDEYFYPVVEHLLACGVPVMAHIGLKPQFVLQAGGYSVTGKSKMEQERMQQQATKFVQMGCFALLIEGVVEPLARTISEQSAVPVIGIGASVACDGQIVVAEDMLGLTPTTAKFIKRYASFHESTAGAFARYAADVRDTLFPARQHTYETPNS